MNIFNEIEYQKIIIQKIEGNKSKGLQTSYSKLAKAIQVSPAYLSRVLGRLAHLSYDQLYLCNQFFNFNEMESEYMELLLQYARSGIKNRQDIILKKVKNIQKKMLSSSEYLSDEPVELNYEGIAEYYLNPLNLLVHMGLLIPRFAENHQQLAQYLGYSLSRIKESIEILERLEVIEIEKGKIKPKRTMHLPPQSSLWKPHQELLRNMVANHLHKYQKQEKTYNLNISFASDHETKEKIQKIFLSFLSEVDELILSSEAKEIFQLNFDLFSWDNKH